VQRQRVGERNLEKGLVLVFTGEGKGKTTAALGLVLRSLGHGDQVAVVQFIKGGWQPGEARALELFGDALHWHALGEGFTWETQDRERDRELVQQAWLRSLTYLADAGTRWAYHNAPYTLLEGVLTTATSTPINTYTQTKLKSKTGMTGSWATVDYDNVFFSKVRSMARYGLLMQNNCIWNTDTLLHDTAYLHSMTQTSQNLNRSYGYLWWLNGKPSYMVPTSQIVFPGSYAPAAPADMFAGLGKNGQILSVSKSQGLVVVRMGNQTSSGEVPTQLCNSIWEKLNAVICSATSLEPNTAQLSRMMVFPNPAQNEITIKLPNADPFEVEIRNAIGQIVLKTENAKTVQTSNLYPGIYLVCVAQGGARFVERIVKLE
jgi:hypothetical protein